MFATIYLPNFYLQAALRYQTPLPNTAVALIDQNDYKATIIQLNSVAESLGIRKGMTPTQALARSLNLVIKTRSHSQEKLIEQIVLHYAFTLSPYVEATAPGLSTVQFTDKRDLLPKLSNVVNQLAACEIVAQTGLAQTPETSFFAAHLARPVLQINDPKRFLDPLPIETLTLGLES